MKKDLDLAQLKIQFKKYLDKLSGHAAFAGILVVLIAYVVVVWRISTLAGVEPSDSDVTAAETASTIPKINRTAVKQIQSLEQSNTSVHSLFNEARNNPFQE